MDMSKFGFIYFSLLICGDKGYSDGLKAFIEKLGFEKGLDFGRLSELASHPDSGSRFPEWKSIRGTSKEI